MSHTMDRMSGMADYYDLETGEELDDYDLHQRYDDGLDEVYGDAHIAGLDIATSRALKEVDPIAYRVGFSDWLDGEIGETISEGPIPKEEGEN